MRKERRNTHDTRNETKRQERRTTKRAHIAMSMGPRRELALPIQMIPRPPVQSTTSPWEVDALLIGRRRDPNVLCNCARPNLAGTRYREASRSC